MQKSIMMRITFDTNVCNVIHDPDKWPSLVAPDDARKIRAAISNQHIEGFVSEGTLFVECLSFPDKLTYLSVAGTAAARPSAHPMMIAMFNDLASIGMEALRAPLIGGEVFFVGMPWTKDRAYPVAERQKRFTDFTYPLPNHGPLKAYGQSLLANQPPLQPPGPVVTRKGGFNSPIPQRWAGAIKWDWDNNPARHKATEKAVRPLISEWCDGLIVGSHFAYGNDIFCTTDRGKNAGSGSLLHPTNRANLAAQGIVVMTPEDLVLRIP